MSTVSHHFMSGSDISALFGDDVTPSAGLLLMPDGGVQVFMAGPPDMNDEDAIGAWTESVDVTEYLLHALDNPTWIAEWQRIQHTLWQDTQEENLRKQREEARSHLKLIHGGKADVE